jgi:phosphatidate phosphatase APP1
MSGQNFLASIKKDMSIAPYFRPSSPAPVAPDGVGFGEAIGRTSAAMAGRVYLETFYAVLSEGGFWLKGSLHTGQGGRPAAPHHRQWHNARNAYRRYRQRPLVGERIHLRFGGQWHACTTDREGLFELFLPAIGMETPTEATQVEVGWNGHTLGAPVFQVSAPQRVVVSDIDDTLLHSYATKPLKGARHLVLRNALNRRPVSGAAAFLRRLQSGDRGAPSPSHPVFYLSNSEWNLWSLLVEFFRHHHFPAGPLLLRDHRVRMRHLLQGARRHVRTHKQQKLDILQQLFPKARMVLLGDSGQRDPLVFWRFQYKHPHRVEAVVIRKAGDQRRRQQVQALALEAQRRKWPWFLVEHFHQALALPEQWVEKQE